MKIYVKNMACKSCVVVVKQALAELEITIANVDLGEIETIEAVSDDNKKKLNTIIKRCGLELLEKKEGVLVEKIKQAAIDYVYNSDEKPSVNFSTLLSQKLSHNYTYLANFFSLVEAGTLEQYIIKLKIERIKELIILEEYSLSEIADKLHYSSVAHLSNQFKKVTGLSPSHFKKLKEQRRIAIQSI